MATWEERADSELGEPLGSLIVTLWAIRLGGEAGAAASTLYNHLLDAELEPSFSNPLIEDISAYSFALGAAWAAGRDEERDR
jgi:hypothetical protein